MMALVVYKPKDYLNNFPKNVFFFFLITLLLSDTDIRFYLFSEKYLLIE